MTLANCLTATGRGVAIAAALSTTSFALGLDNDNAFQNPVGDPASFHMTGPATESSGHTHDEEGDAFLQSVEMATGDVFTHYYRPVAIHHFAVENNMAQAVKIRGGLNSTQGVQGVIEVADADSSGSSNAITDADKTAFVELLRSTMANNNITNYYDTSSSAGDWSFVLEFDLVLKDNDPEPDNFGELLYFERGRNAGNSWLTVQAVDADGNGLGPALALDPEETVSTSPPTLVMKRWDQYFGVIAVDISRLGVSETKYLKVSRTVAGVGGFDGNLDPSEDLNPDFKFMAVITNPEQLAAIQALYD